MGKTRSGWLEKLLAAACTGSLVVVFSGLPSHSATAASDPTRSVILHEDFDSLDQWRPLKFRRIENMCTYTLDPQPDNTCYVKAQSTDCASAMVWKGEFNVYEYSIVRWRWKVSNVYSGGDTNKKEGDDYPMRIYVMFKYDPQDHHVKRNLKYSLAKLFSGRYPPYRSLNYIWANREHNRRFIPSTYTSQTVMVPLRSGPGLAGRWLTEERDILEDYRQAFGEDPPAVAGLAFMNDSDNTGESSVSWIDWIEISRDQDLGQDVQDKVEKTESEQ